MKKFLGTVLVLAIIVGIVWWFMYRGADEVEVPVPEENVAVNEEEMEDIEIEVDGQKKERKAKFTIGDSVEGRAIVARHYGQGEKELLFIGGVHGGYGPSTSRVANELIDYLEEDPSRVPENVAVTVVPVLNPDGLSKVTELPDRVAQPNAADIIEERISGRFNANGVDLNRNFDCQWQATGVWQDREVSGGSSAFSELETQAIRGYIETYRPDAVLVWYSAGGGVFASQCGDATLAETTTLVNLYAEASGYEAHEEFDFYKVTGDLVNWLAKEGIPGLSVLLPTHTESDWAKNKEGIEALLNYYAG